MAKTATLYHDDKQNILHTLLSDVSNDGSHQVVSSTISTANRDDLTRVARYYIAQLGHANVRVYTITLAPF